MIASVKEIFKSLEKSEEQRCYIKSKAISKLNRFRKDYGRPYQKSDKVGMFEHYIFCKCANPSSLIWEKLEINIEQKDKRYCPECMCAVYKVDNKYMFEKRTAKDNCIAVSIDFIFKLNEENSNIKYSKMLEKMYSAHKQLFDSNGYYKTEDLV